MENQKIKITDLTNEQLKIKELGVVTGGMGSEFKLLDGCSSGVCIDNRDVGAQYCEGSAVCTSGIGPCHGKTNGVVLNLI